jgi:hypothetical protein
MDYTNALAITVALSLLVVALQAWGLRRKVTVRSGRDAKRYRRDGDRRKARDSRFLS